MLPPSPSTHAQTLHPHPPSRQVALDLDKDQYGSAPPSHTARTPASHFHTPTTPLTPEPNPKTLTLNTQVALDVDKDQYDKFSMRNAIDLLLMELWKARGGGVERGS